MTVRTELSSATESSAEIRTPHVSNFWANVFPKEFSCLGEECGPVMYLWSAWINVPPW